MDVCRLHIANRILVLVDTRTRKSEKFSVRLVILIIGGSALSYQYAYLISRRSIAWRSTSSLSHTDMHLISSK